MTSAAAHPEEANPAALNPAHREWSLRMLTSQTLDVLVVGGGVTGAGAALDAAARGLSVGLIEAEDYAAGASSKSSKLIHGGLRYLEMLDFGLVREALTERGLLLTKLAPHLVKPVPFLWPLTHRGWERPYVGTGLLLYDTMGGRRAVPRARHLSKAKALRVAPALNPDALVGAVQFYDAQEDAARMVACLARTAAAHGAALATGVRMDGMLRRDGRVTGATATDLLTGAAIEIGARHVALATGAWTSANTGQEMRVRPSKGVHIVVPRHRIPMDTGLLTRTEKSVLFVIPWGEHWVIGDTDTEWPYEPSAPAASKADIDYLLAKANAMLADPLTADDIEGVFAGLRPLVAAVDTADTTRLSREHTVDSSVPGLSVIAGGKYTTYRVMARDLIDSAVRDLTGPGGESGRLIPASSTDRVPLAGADGYRERWASRQRIAGTSGLPVRQVERLLNRYGSDLDRLLDLIGDRPELGDEIPGGGEYLGAEIVFACGFEGAVHLDDALARRTRITIEVRDRGHEAAAHAATLMAGELGWDAARTASEVSRYRSWIAAQLAGEAAPDDEHAYQALKAAAAQPASPGHRPQARACG